MKLVLNSGADVNLPTKAYHKRFSCFTFVDSQRYPSSTLLHIAVQENNFEMVDFLIEHGALLLTKDDSGNTPRGKLYIATN